MSETIFRSLLSQHESEVARRPKRKEPKVEAEPGLINPADAEKQRRIVSTRIGQISTSVDTVMSLFSGFGRDGIVTKTEESGRVSIHSPLLVVEKVEATRRKQPSMAAVKIGLSTPASFSASKDELGRLLEASSSRRMSLVDSMTAYVFKLPYDETQPKGMPVISAEVSDAAIPIAQLSVAPSRTSAYIARADSFWYDLTQEFESRDRQREVSNFFLTVVDTSVAVSSALGTASSAQYTRLA